MSFPDLSRALEAQEKRKNVPDATATVVQEVRDSTIFRYSWEDLLCPGPVAICAMGACIVASSGSGASRTRFERSDFTQLSSSDLRMGLVECVAKGTQAHIQMDQSWLALDLSQKIVKAQVRDLVQILGDPVAMKQILKMQLGKLKDLADKGSKSTDEMDTKVEEWMLCACELHSACVGVESSDDEKILAANLNLAAEQTRYDRQKDTTFQVASAADKFSVALNQASDAFRKRSEQFPSTWNIMGEEIANGLVAASSTAITSLINNLLSCLTPTTNASGMFSGLIRPGQSRIDGANTPAPAKVPQPNFSNDPAYAIVSRELPVLTALYTLLTSGQGNTVNWDDAEGSAKFIASAVSDAASDLQAQATNNQPSTDLAQILKVASEVASAVLSSSSSTADSARVGDWQSRYTAEYLKAQKMVAVTRSRPGAFPAVCPTKTDANTPAAASQVKENSVAGQARLHTARNGFAVALESFAGTRGSYEKNSERLRNQSNMLSTLQQELMQLTNSRLELSEIKAILRANIKLSIQYKEQIMDTRRLCRALSASADAIMKIPAEALLKAISSGSDGGAKMGGITMIDHLTSVLYVCLLNFYAHFDLISECAGMWAKLGQEFLMPSIQLLGQLEYSGPHMFGMIQEYTGDFAKRLNEGVGQKQRRTLEKMQERIDDALEPTRDCPASSEVLIAIKHGVSEVSQAVNEAIAFNSANKPLIKYGSK